LELIFIDILASWLSDGDAWQQHQQKLSKTIMPLDFIHISIFYQPLNALKPTSIQPPALPSGGRKQQPPNWV
jgi:hypothetical protein